MNANTRLASDIAGLIKTALLSRRGFMSASAAAAAGYTLAAGPVRAEAIQTDSSGIEPTSLRWFRWRNAVSCPACGAQNPNHSCWDEIFSCTNTSETSRAASRNSGFGRSALYYYFPEGRPDGAAPKL